MESYLWIDRLKIWGVQVMILAFLSIAPISLGYWAMGMMYWYSTGMWFHCGVICSFSTLCPIELRCAVERANWFFVFELWFFSEVIFYFYYLWRKTSLQRLTKPPRKIPLEKKLDFLMKCLSNSKDSKKSLSGWFFGAPFESIKRGNYEEFIAWSFFHKTMAQITEEESFEINMLVQLTENFEKVKFVNGNNPIFCMKPTLEEYQPLYHPFVYYLSVFFLEYLILRPLLNAWGFRRMKCGSLNYWHAPQTTTEQRTNGKSPLVFLHGIGIGLIPYLFFLKKLPAERDRFLFEFPYIASVLSETVPAPFETVDSIAMTLKEHGFRKATFVSHSFGTIICGWLVKNRPDLVANTVFIDPVCFLLNEPDVTFKFFYRLPRTWNDWLLYYFAAKEMGICHTFSRHFWPCENVLWKEDFSFSENQRHLIFLSANDSIVNAHAIMAFLEKNPKLDFETFWFDSLPHAGFLQCKESFNIVSSAVENLD